MPVMPVLAATDSFSDLFEGLAADCERLANKRVEGFRALEAEQQAEMIKLRKENQELRKRLGESTNDVSPPMTEAANDKLAKAPLVKPESEGVRARPPDEVATENWVGKHESERVASGLEADLFEQLPGAFAHLALKNVNYIGQQIRMPQPLDVGIPTLASMHHWTVFDPTHHTKLAWDILGIPVLGWDLITIPMGVYGISDSDVMKGMGWVTLIFWTIDIPITFRTGIFTNDASLVMDPCKIAKHYLHGPFWLDAIIIGADWVGVLMGFVGDDAPSFLANLSMLRILRISRFARLLRLRKLKAKWQSVEDGIDNEWILVLLSLFGKCTTILAMNHYLGCIWYAIGDIRIQGYDSWLTSTRYPQYGGTGTMDDAPWGYQYVTSLHWAISQFTPGGTHIHPQNIPERLYCIWCLMFGLVVFSSFIASVTQARMQLARMMSKFERDLWTLRKFCRQNNISMSLTIRMRRYVDMVLIPKYHHMNSQDCILLPQLSLDLREELQTELALAKLRCHPFFAVLEEESQQNWNKCLLKSLCNTAVESLSPAKGDVIFSIGEVANKMVIVLSSFLVYLPLSKDQEISEVYAGHWVSEACLWTPWSHQGELQATEEATIMNVLSQKFNEVLKNNGLIQLFAKTYANAFLAALNVLAKQDSMVTDLQEDITKKLNIKQMETKTYFGGVPAD